MSQLSGWVVLQHLLLLLLLLLRLQRLFRYLLGFRHRQTVSLQTLSCPKKKRCSLFGVDARGSPTQSEEQCTATHGSRCTYLHTQIRTYIHTLVDAVGCPLPVMGLRCPTLTSGVCIPRTHVATRQPETDTLWQTHQYTHTHTYPQKRHHCSLIHGVPRLTFFPPTKDSSILAAVSITPDCFRFRLPGREPVSCIPSFEIGLHWSGSSAFLSSSLSPSSCCYCVRVNV